jgi:hypothetical protein
VTGHKPFNELTKNFTPQPRARVAAKAAALHETMTLQELCKARSLTQEEVAEALTVGQPAAAKLEKRGDMHVGNLRRYVEALGGTPLTSRTRRSSSATWANRLRTEGLGPCQLRRHPERHNRPAVGVTSE